MACACMSGIITVPLTVIFGIVIVQFILKFMGRK